VTTRDKDGQVLLATFLQAYAASPHRTEGNLPGGGRLFETCARAVEPIPDDCCVFCRAVIRSGDVCRACHDAGRDK
jgi:hypothetical protein